MKSNSIFRNLTAITVGLLPLAYAWSIYDSLPDTIPTHFGIHGPDQFGNKSNIWVVTLILALASIVQYFLMENMEKIDPKKSAKYAKDAYQKLSLGLVIFLAAISLFIIHSTAQGALNEKILVAGLGLLFIFLGNLLYSIKPNYFVGFRLPWTLKNEDNWKKTHLLGGKMMFGAGVLMVLASFFLSSPPLIYVFLVITAVTVIYPIWYSYSLSKKSNQYEK
jgi:uncharacterized membrane protein